jgi:uncharacterized protein
VTGQSWDGAQLLGALERAVSALEAHVDEVNALNVFPVPDGDTGSNMLATLQAAIAEAAAVPVAQRSVARVASSFGFGALMGARGNSGVILSQFFRGIADAVDGQREVDGRDLAGGFARACDAAYAAVGRPVEGTILTVARELSTAAREAAEHDPAVEAVLAAAVQAASSAVARTPSMLPVLQQAGVVDAGGRGLEILLQGTLAYARGEPVAAPPARPDGEFPTFTLPEEEDEFGYETVFVVQSARGSPLVPAQVRDRLEQIGQSVVVAGDERALKIHVHSERPDEVLALGLTLGALSDISIENLDGQARELRASRSHALAGSKDAAPVTARPQRARLEDGRAVVAVAPGEGLAVIFERLGAAAAVMGGQGANPSAGELAEAIHGTGMSEVIVLPNNPNVRLAARQAGDLCPDVSVEVVPTRNPAEGVGAMLAFDGQADLGVNVKSMLRNARSLQTLQVTAAVRDARMGRRKVKRGDHIVLGPEDGLLAADSDRNQAVLAAVGRLKPGFELLTVYHGEGADAGQAAELADLLTEHLDGVEVEVVDGGQPHYSYLISAE